MQPRWKKSKIEYQCRDGVRMNQETLLTSLIDEYTNLYERHLKLLKMVQKIIPLIDSMEDSRERTKIIKILVNTSNNLLRDLDIE